MAIKRKSPAELGLDRKIKAWEKKDLGAQIGGLIHDAVALTVAEKKLKPERIKFWLNTLYNISESKKTELTAPKPIPDPFKINEEWERRMKQDRAEALADEANRQAMEAAEYQKENPPDEEDIPIIEEENE